MSVTKLRRLSLPETSEEPGSRPRYKLCVRMEYDDEVNGSSKPLDPFEQFRSMRDAYLDSMAKLMVGTVNTEKYAQATGAMLEIPYNSAPFREAMENQCCRSCSNFRCHPTGLHRWPTLNLDASRRHGRQSWIVSRSRPMLRLLAKQRHQIRTEVKTRGAKRRRQKELAAKQAQPTNEPPEGGGSHMPAPVMTDQFHFLRNGCGPSIR